MPCLYFHDLLSEKQYLLQCTKSLCAICRGEIICALKQLYYPLIKKGILLRKEVEAIEAQDLSIKKRTFHTQFERKSFATLCSAQGEKLFYFPPPLCSVYKSCIKYPRSPKPPHRSPCGQSFCNTVLSM